MSGMRAGSSLNPRQRDFLLEGSQMDGDNEPRQVEHRTEWHIRDHYLQDWPGRVALVVGGSNDMRSVQGANAENLRGVKIKTLHGHTERGSLGLPPRCLLMCTETLFRRERQPLRDSLDLVFDVCEIHRILLRHTTACGWSDVLETLNITSSEQSRRARMLGNKYYPDVGAESLL